MVKHTQTICWHCLSVFGHFVGLALQGLSYSNTWALWALRHLSIKSSQALRYFATSKLKTLNMPDSFSPKLVLKLSNPPGSLGLLPAIISKFGCDWPLNEKSYPINVYLNAKNQNDSLNPSGDIVHHRTLQFNCSILFWTITWVSEFPQVCISNHFRY